MNQEKIKELEKITSSQKISFRGIFDEKSVEKFFLSTNGYIVRSIRNPFNDISSEDPPLVIEIYDLDGSHLRTFSKSHNSLTTFIFNMPECVSKSMFLALSRKPIFLELKNDDYGNELSQTKFRNSRKIDFALS